jgi:hypothetical protein
MIDHDTVGSRVHHPSTRWFCLFPENGDGGSSSAIAFLRATTVRGCIAFYVWWFAAEEATYANAMAFPSKVSLRINHSVK